MWFQNFCLDFAQQIDFFWFYNIYIDRFIKLCKFCTEPDEKKQDFIVDQKIFFVGTAAPDGLLNLNLKVMKP